MSAAAPPMTNAEAAQLIARTLGPIIPICYLEDGACACGGKYDRDAGTFALHTGHDLGKAPISRLVINGVDDATTNSAKIDLWWRRHPQAGVGVSLKPARKVFIDPDSPEALTEATALGIDGGVRRDSRNVGFLFNRQADCPSDIGITKSADKTELEIQTFGYAVVWGTHANGSLVRVDLDAPPKDTPGWAVERLKAKAASKATQDAVRATRRAERAAQGIVGDEPLWQLDDVAMERWNGTLYEVDSAGNLDRSRSLYRLGIELANHGATEAGIRWAVENRDAALGWKKYTDRDDADKRYDEIAEKVVADGIRRGKPLWQMPPTEGSDGAEACQGCIERDHTIEALNGYLGEYKAADELVRHGPFTPDAAQVVKHLVTVAEAARRNGQEKIPLLREEVARLALGATGWAAEKAVSRALKAYIPYQDDPDLAATIPYRLEWDERGRKTHIDLVPLTPETPRTKEEQYRVLAQLPKDRKPPAKVIERDESCRRCHSPEGVEARGTRRCLNEACGHTWHTRPVILGRTVTEDEQPAPEPLPLLVGTLPGQNVPASTSTYAGQNVPANEPAPDALTSVSFPPRDNLEAFDTPNYLITPAPVAPHPASPVHGPSPDAVIYWGPGALLDDLLPAQGEAPPESPPPPKPLPIAPRSQIAGAFRRHAPPAMKGAEE